MDQAADFHVLTQFDAAGDSLAEDFRVINQGTPGKSEILVNSVVVETESSLLMRILIILISIMSAVIIVLIVYGNVQACKENRGKAPIAAAEPQSEVKQEVKSVKFEEKPKVFEKDQQ